MNTRHRIAPFWFVLLLIALLAPALLAQAPTDGAFLPEGIEATGDTAEVRALTAWVDEHRHVHPEQARQAAERALVLARDLDDQQGIAESLTVLGHMASDLFQKEAYYRETIERFERVGDEHGMIRIRLFLGHVYSDQGELEEALTAYFDALEGFKRFDDTAGQVMALSSIGNAHRDQGNLEEAVTHHRQAIALAEKSNNPGRLVPILINLGAALTDQGSYEEAETQFRRALTVSEEHGYRRFTAFISNNLGGLLVVQGRYERALSYLFNAKRLSEELDEDGLLIAVYDELAKAYLGLDQHDRALHYANESLRLAQNVGLYQMKVHQTLSQIHEAAGNHEQALIHQRRYAAARDSVYNAEKTEIITQMQARYETEEKQRAIENLEQENRIQALRASRRQTLLLAGVGGLLLLLAFLFSRYRLKQKANRLLEDLDAAKSRFFANISHEFRTPLTVILGGLQDTISGRFGKVSGKVVAQQHAMLRNTQQLQHLIDEVLNLNRLEAGKLALKLAPGDLVRSLRRIVEADAPLAERNGIDLTFEPNVERCPRLFDAEKLEKIVGNLLSNALKFTPKDGSVRVSLECGKKTIITVSDDGPGIPAEAQEKVFERFAQVEDGALHGGAGIGLALAKELAELHGGAITLKSEPGEGSTFTVRLPLEETTLDDVQRTAPLRAAHRAAARQARGALHSSAKRTGGGPTSKEELEIGGDGAPPSEQSQEKSDRTTVLIIEDNDDVRAYVRRSLETTYQVLEARDGEDGLQQAREALPDLIVSDVMLPGIDGYEVARRLKAEPDVACILVVMLTARAAVEDQVEGYGAGAEAYVVKPFSPETLRAAIARLLEERRRLRRQLQERTEVAKDEKAQTNGHETLRARARAVVIDNLHEEEFSVEVLASSLGMSRHTLYRHVKEETGLAPSDFVRSLRLERARELLANGAGSVSEVAYAVGFKSLSHFTRSFREHFGRSPSSILEGRKG